VAVLLTIAALQSSSIFQGPPPAAVARHFAPPVAAHRPLESRTEEPPPVVPKAGRALSLADLSGPELEALLDLVERQPDRAASIAF
jgi:hypothetical protein